MKKFLIRFDYHGFLFSAKVIVKRDNGKMNISTTVLNNELIFLLEDGKLIFIERGTGFEMVIFKKDRSFEILDWKIKLELVDKTKIADTEAFSLS